MGGRKLQQYIARPAHAIAGIGSQHICHVMVRMEFASEIELHLRILFLRHLDQISAILFDDIPGSLEHIHTEMGSKYYVFHALRALIPENIHRFAKRLRSVIDSGDDMAVHII